MSRTYDHTKNDPNLSSDEFQRRVANRANTLLAIQEAVDDIAAHSRTLGDKSERLNLVDAETADFLATLEALKGIVTSYTHTIERACDPKVFQTIRDNRSHQRGQAHADAKTGAWQRRLEEDDAAAKSQRPGPSHSCD